MFEIPSVSLAYTLVLVLRARHAVSEGVSVASAQTHSKDSGTTIPWARLLSEPPRFHCGLHKGRRNLRCTFCQSQCTRLSLILCTVPVPTPWSLASLMMPTPPALRSALMASTFPASVEGRPRTFP